MCSRPRLLSVRNRNRYAHSSRTGEGLRKTIKNYAPGPLSRGRPPRKMSRRRTRYTFLFIRTHAHTSPVYTVCIVVLRKASNDRISLVDETSSSSAFVSLQILIAFAPNPTYTFSAASATPGVCRFPSKQARRTRFEFIQHIRDLTTKMHVTCPQTYLYTTVSCPYEGRARYTSTI